MYLIDPRSLSASTWAFAASVFSLSCCKMGDSFAVCCTRDTPFSLSDWSRIIPSNFSILLSNFLGFGIFKEPWTVGGGLLSISFTISSVSASYSACRFSKSACCSSGVMPPCSASNFLLCFFLAFTASGELYSSSSLSAVACLSSASISVSLCLSSSYTLASPTSLEPFTFSSGVMPRHFDSLATSSPKSVSPSSSESVSGGGSGGVGSGVKECSGWSPGCTSGVGSGPSPNGSSRVEG